MLSPLVWLLAPVPAPNCNLSSAYLVVNCCKHLYAWFILARAWQIAETPALESRGQSPGWGMGLGVEICSHPQCDSLLSYSLSDWWQCLERRQTCPIMACLQRIDSYKVVSVSASCNWCGLCDFCLRQKDLNLNEESPLSALLCPLLHLCRQSPLLCLVFACAWQVSAVVPSPGKLPASPQAGTKCPSSVSLGTPVW